MIFVNNYKYVDKVLNSSANEDNLMTISLDQRHEDDDLDPIKANKVLQHIHDSNDNCTFFNYIYSKFAQF